jgi:hypothetical protein
MTTKMKMSLAALLALAVVLPAQQDQNPSQQMEIGARCRKVVEEHGAGVVSISVVIKIEFMGRSQEQRLQARGMLVSDTGLIMTADGVVDPQVNVTSGGRDVEGVKTEVEDIKVVFGNEEEEQDAFLVGKDSRLGFSFLQVRDFDPKKRTIKIPDYSKAESPGIGDILVTPNRLEKGFDYAPYFTFAWVTGEIKKPLKSLLLSSGTEPGLPAYDLSGRLAGAHARLKPSVGGGNPKTVLLRGAVVDAAIQQALRRAEEMRQELKDDDGEGDAVEVGSDKSAR